MVKGVLEALNVRVLGSGERAVVLSHGFGGDQPQWARILPSLVSDYKVILFDMAFAVTVNPAHFDFDRFSSLSAYASDLLAILEELEVRKCMYVGHSVSGMIGCIASIQKPHLFERLVLLAASPRYLNDGSYVGGFEREDIDGIFSTVKSDYAAWVSSFARQLVGVDEPWLVKEYSTKMGNMKPEIAFAALKTIFESDMRSILCEVKIPCSIIQTIKDVVVPMGVGYYMQHNLGGEMNTVNVPETDGHLPHVTSPQMLANLLLHILGN